MGATESTVRPRGGATTAGPWARYGSLRRAPVPRAPALAGLWPLRVGAGALSRPPTEPWRGLHRSFAPRGPGDEPLGRCPSRPFRLRCPRSCAAHGARGRLRRGQRGCHAPACGVGPWHQAGGPRVHCPAPDGPRDRWGDFGAGRRFAAGTGRSRGRSLVGPNPLGEAARPLVGRRLAGPRRLCRPGPPAPGGAAAVGGVGPGVAGLRHGTGRAAGARRARVDQGRAK